MPKHTSHFTNTSGKKFISISFNPPPLQFSHLPPVTLKLNLPGLYPLIKDSGTLEYNVLTSENNPVYVAGLLLGVLPIGD